MKKWLTKKKTMNNKSNISTIVNNTTKVLFMFQEISEGLKKQWMVYNFFSYVRVNENYIMYNVCEYII